MMEEIREWGWAILLALGVLYAAFRDKLGFDFVRRRDYEAAIRILASKVDLDGVGSRVNALETVAIMAKDTADQNSDRLTKIEASGTEHSVALSRTLTRIDQRLDDMDNRHRAAQSQIDKTAALLDEITRRLDRANH